MHLGPTQTYILYHLDEFGEASAESIAKHSETDDHVVGHFSARAIRRSAESMVRRGILGYLSPNQVYFSMV